MSTGIDLLTSPFGKAAADTIHDLTDAIMGKARAPSGNDYVMKIKGKRSGALKADGGGESIPILGFNSTAQRTVAVHGNTGDTGGASGVRHSLFWVNRSVDAASASILNMLETHDEVTVVVQIFKSGESLDGRNAKPFLEYTLSEAFIMYQGLVTSGSSGPPAESIAFSYKAFRLETAEQLSSGLRSGVRVCEVQNVK